MRHRCSPSNPPNCMAAWLLMAGMVKEEDGGGLLPVTVGEHHTPAETIITNNQAVYTNPGEYHAD